MTHTRARGVAARPGRVRRLGIVAACFGLLGLTFVGGALVGRHWVRPAPSVAIAEAPKKASPAPRRSGLVEAEPERPGQAPEKLTFYQTLTAPLGPAPSFARPNGDGKPKPGDDRAAPGRERPKTEERSRAEEGPRSAAAPAEGGTEEGPPAAPAAPGAAAGAATWSVQVGAFKSRQQADAVQKQLQDAGFEAYVSTIGTEDGQTRYRVRVGSFTTRPDAERMADRVRAERSLATHITAN